MKNVGLGKTQTLIYHHAVINKWWNVNFTGNVPEVMWWSGKEIFQSSHYTTIKAAARQAFKNDHDFYCASAEKRND